MRYIDHDVVDSVLVNTGAAGHGLVQSARDVNIFDQPEPIEVEEHRHLEFEGERTHGGITYRAKLTIHTTRITRNA